MAFYRRNYDPFGNRVCHRRISLGTIRGSQRRTQLIGEVRGDIGSLFNQWVAFGGDQVTFYGDMKKAIIEFAKALELDLVEES